MRQMFEATAINGLTALALLAIPLSSGIAQDASGAAQQANLAAPPSTRVGLGRGAPVAVAVRAFPDAPRIDGHLDEAVWQQATPISDFTQRDPDEGEPASEQTEVWVLYTDDAMYVGVRAHDSQADEIRGQLTRRDEDSPSDWIGVAIDSYYDRRTAFAFLVNPAGVKRDVYYFDDGDADNSWNAVWDVKTTRDSEGWTAEFRIPFSQLRFQKGQDRFGFNIYRRIDRLNEEQYWRVPPKGENGFVSRFGELVGLDGVDPPRRVEVLPYMAATGDLYNKDPGNPFRAGKDRTGSMGVDLNLGLTSNLTLSATVNPDFGQVEADPAVVNLSAFETFFPEKRPFFLEGIDIFQFGIGLGDGDGGNEQLFYTRRIGRAPQGSADRRGGHREQIGQTTILGSAKLSGKTPSGWTVGTLASVTAEESASAIDSAGNPFKDVVEPRSSYFVGTLARDFRDGQTQIGIFGTAMNRSLPDQGNLNWLRNRAFSGGLRWSHRFANQTYSLSGWVAGSHVRGSETAIAITQRSSARYYQRPDNEHVTYDPNRTSLSGVAGRLSFGKIAGSTMFSTGVDTRSPGFEVNDMGFQRNADRSISWLWIGQRWLEPGKVFRRFQMNFNAWTAYSYGWERTGTGGNVNGNFTFLNYWRGGFGIGRDLEALSVGALRGGPAFISPGGSNVWASLGSDPRKTFRFGVSSFYGRQDDNSGWSHHAAGNLSWRAATNLDFTIAPSIFRQRDGRQYYTFSNALNQDHYVFGELEQTVTSLTLRADMTFTPNMSLQVYAEPFVAVGDYTTFKEISDPRADTFDDRFNVFSDEQILDDGEGNISIDLDGSGQGDIFLGNSDFTVVSFRSNVVLRWEYMLGSTLFFVWQHNRSDDNNNPNYDLTSHVGDIFNAPASNTFVVKINYWLSM